MKPNFNRFDEIENTSLRAYNRTVLAYNLRDDFGKNVCEEYLEGFDEASKKQIFCIISLIKIMGKDKLLKQITSELNVDYDAGEDNV